MRAAIVIVLLVARTALADPSATLRDANAAATAGDWPRVSTLVDPLLGEQLDPAALAEAHRLAGIAAFFEQRPRDAEGHFLAYLRFDLDGRLDPTLYPPDVVTFFEDVRSRHAAELRALRPRPKQHAILTLLPPFGQFQNGDTTKGWVLVGLYGAFAAANVTGYLVLRSWCTRVVGPDGSSLVCDAHQSATTFRSMEIIGGVGLIATYVYGVYDGVTTYRRNHRTRLVAPFASPTNEGAVIGVTGSF